jgi:ABC-type Mn2+/Zn2+ transport system permease subunit
VATAVVLFYKELQFSIYDPEMAEVSGIPARAILLALSFLMALTIVASLRAVGELLILALIVLPASSAYQWAHSLRRMIFISIILGISASISGLIMAFNLEAPAGSTIVILLGLIFFASLVCGERRSNRF